MCSTGSSCGQQGVIFNISYHRHQGLLKCHTFVTNHAFSNASRSIYLFLAQWRLVLLWKCCFHKVSLLFITTLTLYHKIHELFYLWCQTNLELQEKLCNKCPSGKSLKTAVIVTFLARSLALHRMTEPQEALWHFGGQCGARDCQNCKMCQMCQFD